MRRIINSTYISLDGVIQDPQDWPDNGIEPDDTGLKVQTDLLFACDAVLMGGLTYPAMAAAWMARSGDPMSDRINSMTKYVVSSTLRDPEWNNTTVISGDVITEIRRLKEQPAWTSSSTGSASCRTPCSSTACSTSCGCGSIRCSSGRR